MFYWYGIDWTYLVLVLPAMIFALIAQGMVTSTFNKYAKKATRCGMTGYQAANMILEENGIHDVRIERISGNLNDHFDPKAKVIRLSDSVYSSTSVAALGVAAHEAGHAVQHNVDYFPMKIRSAIIPATQIGSNLALPLVLLGLLFSFPTLAYLGVAFFGLSSLFQLVTLPVEFNASNRALDALRDGNILVGNEINSAKKVLSAAAMTYVAALAVSLANLLRLFMMVNRNSRR